METKQDLIEAVAEYAENIMSGSMTDSGEVALLPDILIFLDERLSAQSCSSECVNEVETRLKKSLGDFDSTLHKQHEDFFRIHARRMDSIERKLKILAFAMGVLLGLTIYLLLSR